MRQRGMTATSPKGLALFAAKANQNARGFLADIVGKPKSDKQPIIGFSPARGIEHFSIRKPMHILIVTAIVISVFGTMYFIHFLMNDFVAMEKRQKTERYQIEDLFREEIQFLKENQRRSLKEMEKTHDKDLSDELNWFLDEMAVANQRTDDVSSDHTSAQQKLKRHEQMHEMHGEEQKQLDEQLNGLYTTAGDKIQYLQKETDECNRKKIGLDTQIADAKKSKDLASKTLPQKVEPAKDAGEYRERDQYRRNDAHYNQKQPGQEPPAQRPYIAREVNDDKQRYYQSPSNDNRPNAGQQQQQYVQYPPQERQRRQYDANYGASQPQAEYRKEQPNYSPRYRNNENENSARNVNYQQNDHYDYQQHYREEKGKIPPPPKDYIKKDF